MLIILKKGKIAIIIVLVVTGVLLLGGAGVFYTVSDGTFDPAVLTNIFTNTTEPDTTPATEPATKKPTQPPTDPIPEIQAEISNQNLDVTGSETAQISAKVNGTGNKKYNIRYTTSDENIASVDTTGLVTPMSKGECQVGVYVEGYDTTIKNFTVTVSDYRIDEINVLNEYLFSLKTTEEYTYAKTKKGNAKISGCKIDDFNDDGSYELFIIYKMADNFQKAKVVTVSSGVAVVSETDKDYSDIVNSGYASYIEDIYVDANGNINILAEYSRIASDYSDKTTELYTTVGGAVKQTEYYCKEPTKLGDMDKKAVYKIDDKKKERDEYTTLYTSLKTSRELFDDYISIVTRLSEGNYTKAEMPADIGTAYYKRVKWTSSDQKIATVSDSGVITGASKAGACTVTGTIPGFDTPVCKMTVEVSAVTDEFASYIDSIKDKYIVGEAGNKMKLYGYYVTDLDGDGTTDLLLYYTGGNGCQLNMMHFVGTNPSTQTLKSATTENGVSCILDLYIDSMNNNAAMLYVANVRKTDKSLETNFSYETFENGQFVPSASEYTYIENSSTGKKEFKVGGSSVEEENFNDMLNRYRKMGDWILVK